MDFFTHVDDAQELLRRHGRVSRRGLRRELGDDDLVAEIIDELVVRGVARIDGDVVVLIDSTVEPEPMTARQPDELPDGEIRNLTVLFFDTVGSTELSEIVSSEDWSEAMRASLEMATASIEEFGGYVGGYMGDGLIAYFGYPVAQEDAPERAVRAGLSMLSAVVDLNETGGLAIDRELSVRVGIHTGPVVLDHVAGTTQAMGRTANLAARIESVAPTNAVVISGETRRLVAGIFITEDLGARELKGFAEPVSIIRVTAVGGLRRRAGRSTTNPLLGRASDIDLMHDCWIRAEAGVGGIIEIIGEAGVGKSSLVDAFRESLVDVAHSWLDSMCTPLARSAPLFPIAELQARGLGFRVDATAAARRSAIETHMANIDLDPDHAVRMLTSLHGLEDAASPPYEDAAVQRIELFEFMLDWIATLARRQATVLVIEDLHWADPTTLDFVERLASRSLREPLLVLLTSRPERVRELHDEISVTRLDLSRLDRAQSQALVRSITGNALDAGVVDSIVDRGDGVPLFLEELADAAVRNPEGFEVPATVQNVLMARLDSVRGVRPVARAASIVGREFSVADLELLLDQPESEWREDLELGVQNGVFFEREAAGTTEFVFKHSLMRDAVYDSMLRRDRSRLHLTMARGIADRHPMLADRRPDLVAEHLEAAGHDADASVWWQRAAELANRTASASEAERFYRKALESVDPTDRSRQVELEIARAGALSNLHGFGHEQLETAWSNILELTEAQEFDWHRAMGNAVLATTVCQRDISEARRTAAISETIAKGRSMPDVRIALDALETMLHFYEGWPLDCIELTEPHLAADPSDTDDFNRGLGIAVVPMINAFRGEAFASLGRYAEAAAAHERASEQAATLGPSTQTLLITVAASSPMQRDDIQHFVELSDRFLEQARRYDLGYSILTGELQSVASHLILEPDDVGLARLDDLQDRLAHGGRVLAVPIFAWILARARQSCGHLEVADGTAAVAQAVAESTGQRWLDGHLCAFRLELAEQMGQLEPDWFESTQPVLDFLNSRSLYTGALYLAAQRRTLAADGLHAEVAAQQLAASYSLIAEPDDSPLLVRARTLLGT